MSAEGGAITGELAQDAADFHGDNTDKLAGAATQLGATKNAIDQVKEETFKALDMHKQELMDECVVVLSMWEKLGSAQRKIVATGIGQSQTLLLNDIINRLKDRL